MGWLTKAGIRPVSGWKCYKQVKKARLGLTSQERGAYGVCTLGSRPGILRERGADKSSMAIAKLLAEKKQRRLAA